MKEENLRKFELNKSILQDFDALMSLRLDFVEELIVTEIDDENKLLNIVGLCINVKTLVVKGDYRIKIDSILANICKPELLTSLIVDNVKLPTNVKKLVSLQNILLNNVKFSNVGNFLQDIPKPEKITQISLCNVDFGKNSIEILKRFKSLEFIYLDRINDCEFNSLKFLSENKNLQKVVIKNNHIGIKEANTLVSTECKKNVLVRIGEKDILEINENNDCSITVSTDNLKCVTQKMNLCKIDTIKIIINEENNIMANIKNLKKLRKGITISVENISDLDINELEEIKNNVSVNRIYIRDEIGEKTYPVNSYINIRNEIDNMIKDIDNDLTEAEKFLKVYRILGENIEVDDLMEVAKTDITKLENALKEKLCTSMMFARILKYCLDCLKIESKVIGGYHKDYDDYYMWNQVRIEDKWYNVDIVEDSAYIAKQGIFNSRVKNCLIEDEIFYKTHTTTNKNAEEVLESYDKKLIRIHLNEIGILKRIIDKIIKVFAYNKQLTLPGAKIENNK